MANYLSMAIEIVICYEIYGVQIAWSLAEILIKMMTTKPFNVATHQRVKEDRKELE